MRVMLVSLIFLVLASQVSALSCLRPNVAKTFNQLQQVEDVYRIGVGKIRLTAAVHKFEGGKPRTTKAEFRGKFLGLNGLVAEQRLAITIQTHCLAHWCGGIPQDSTIEHLVFLRQSPTGEVLDMGACPDGILSTPTGLRVETLQSCLRRGKCTDSEINAMDRF
jgi:hypothetical protein